MGIKLVNPDEPSIQPERKMVVLPVEEKFRIRRAGRQAFDQYLPEAMRVVADALLSEDMEDRRWAADKVIKAVLASKPNEEVDPESAVVNGSVASKDALRQLEDSTQDGTGMPDPDETK